MIDEEIQNYKSALEESISASKDKFNADVRQRKARQALIMARNQLHDKTYDLLEECELNRL